jgi:hypothetical protein
MFAEMEKMRRRRQYCHALFNLSPDISQYLDFSSHAQKEGFRHIYKYVKSGISFVVSVQRKLISHGMYFHEI